MGWERAMNGVCVCVCVDFVEREKQIFVCVCMRMSSSRVECLWQKILHIDLAYVWMRGVCGSVDAGMRCV